MGRKGHIFLNYHRGQKTLELHKKNPNFILPTSRKNEVIKFVEKVSKIYL